MGFGVVGFFCLFFKRGRVLSKQDVIARSLNSRREVVYKGSKHVLCIQQVVLAYRTQKYTYTP